jgi:hypothetical protein
MARPWKRDNPQGPGPVDRRANPPAPGRLGPGGSSVPRGTPTAFPSLARESLVLQPVGRLDLTTVTGVAHTRRRAVRRPGPSALLAGAPTRISRSSRVSPSGQLMSIGAQEVGVKVAFLLASHVCPASGGSNYFDGVSGEEPSLGPSVPGCAPVWWDRHSRPWRTRSRPGPGCAATGSRRPTRARCCATGTVRACAGGRRCRPRAGRPPQAEARHEPNFRGDNLVPWQHRCCAPRSAHGGASDRSAGLTGRRHSGGIG